MDAAIKYCAVYCEVNLSLGGSAKIDLMTALNDYPAVPEGDDLTENPNGTARLVLYRFIAQSGNISNVNKVVTMMLYGAVITTRPPISSISFQNGQTISVSKYSAPKTGDRESAGDIAQSNANTLIGYLPKDSNNGIAKVDFAYSGKEMFYYVANSNGNLICYWLVSEKPVNGSKADITATITDIYGNEHTINWSIVVHT